MRKNKKEKEWLSLLIMVQSPHVIVICFVVLMIILTSIWVVVLALPPILALVSVTIFLVVLRSTRLRSIRALGVRWLCFLVVIVIDLRIIHVINTFGLCRLRWLGILCDALLES